MKSIILQKVKEMRRNKLVIVVLVTVFSLWVSRAEAIPEPAYQFQKIDFKLVTVQQELQDSETSSNLFVSTIKASAIINKDLLSYLATAFDTNWPDGAQLALDNIRRNIFVVDETGTNPVFDVSTGINVGESNVVYFGFESDGKIVSSKSVVHGKSDELLRVTIGTESGMDFFHLFDEQDGVTNTDLYFDGLNARKFHSETTITNNEIIMGHTVASEQMSVTGDGIFNGKWVVVKGEVTGSANLELSGGIPGSPIINPIAPFLPTNWPPPIFPIPTNLPPIIIITNQPPPVIITGP